MRSASQAGYSGAAPAEALFSLIPVNATGACASTSAAMKSLPELSEVVTSLYVTRAMEAARAFAAASGVLTGPRRNALQSFSHIQEHSSCLCLELSYSHIDAGLSRTATTFSQAPEIASDVTAPSTPIAGFPCQSEARFVLPQVPAHKVSIGREKNAREMLWSEAEAEPFANAIKRHNRAFHLVAKCLPRTTARFCTAYYYTQFRKTAVYAELRRLKDATPQETRWDRELVRRDRAWFHYWRLDESALGPVLPPAAVPLPYPLRPFVPLEKRKRESLLNGRHPASIITKGRPDEKSPYFESHLDAPGVVQSILPPDGKVGIPAVVLLNDVVIDKAGIARDGLPSKSKEEREKEKDLARQGKLPTLNQEDRLLKDLESVQNIDPLTDIQRLMQRTQDALATAVASYMNDPSLGAMAAQAKVHIPSLADVASKFSEDALPGVTVPWGPHNYSDSWDRYVDNESYCSMCGDGGALICCDGPCRRSFHVDCLKQFDAGVRATLRASPALQAAPVFQNLFNYDRDGWQCSSCITGLHECFICGETGLEGVNVFRCMRMCGKLFHLSCLKQNPRTVFLSSNPNAPLVVIAKDDRSSQLNSEKAVADALTAQLLINADQTDSELMKLTLLGDTPKIPAGTSTRFVCPFHSCATCNGPFNPFLPPLYYRCHACPSAFHADCVPRGSFFDMADIVTCPNTAAHEAKKMSLSYRGTSGVMRHTVAPPEFAPSLDAHALQQARKNAMGRVRIGDGLERKLAAATHNDDHQPASQQRKGQVLAAPVLDDKRRVAGGGSDVSARGRAAAPIVKTRTTVKPAKGSATEPITTVSQHSAPTDGSPLIQQSPSVVKKEKAKDSFSSMARTVLVVHPEIQLPGYPTHFELLDSLYYLEIARRAAALVATGVAKRIFTVGESMNLGLRDVPWMKLATTMANAHQGVKFAQRENKSNDIREDLRFIAMVQWKDRLVFVGSFSDIVDAAVAVDYTKTYVLGHGITRKELNYPDTVSSCLVDAPIDPWPPSALENSRNGNPLPTPRVLDGDLQRYSVFAPAHNRARIFKTKPMVPYSLTQAEEAFASAQARAKAIIELADPGSALSGLRSVVRDPEMDVSVQDATQMHRNKIMKQEQPSAGSDEVVMQPIASGSTPASSESIVRNVPEDPDQIHLETLASDESELDSVMEIEAETVVQGSPLSGQKRKRDEDGAQEAADGVAVSSESSTVKPKANLMVILPSASPTEQSLDSGSRRLCGLRSHTGSGPTKQKSQYIGVLAASTSQKTRWCARIYHGDRVHHLGTFDTELEAAIVYDAAAIRLRGRKAMLNFALTPEGFVDETKRARQLVKDQSGTALMILNSEYADLSGLKEIPPQFTDTDLDSIKRFAEDLIKTLTRRGLLRSNDGPSPIVHPIAPVGSATGIAIMPRVDPRQAFLMGDAPFAGPLQEAENVRGVFRCGERYVVRLAVPAVSSSASFNPTFLGPYDTVDEAARSFDRWFLAMWGLERAGPYLNFRNESPAPVSRLEFLAQIPRLICGAPHIHPDHVDWWCDPSLPKDVQHLYSALCRLQSAAFPPGFLDVLNLPHPTGIWQHVPVLDSLHQMVLVDRKVPHMIDMPATLLPAPSVPLVGPLFMAGYAAWVAAEINARYSAYSEAIRAEHEKIGIAAFGISAPIFTGYMSACLDPSGKGLAKWVEKFGYAVMPIPSDNVYPPVPTQFSAFEQQIKAVQSLVAQDRCGRIVMFSGSNSYMVLSTSSLYPTDPGADLGNGRRLISPGNVINSSDGKAFSITSYVIPSEFRVTYQAASFQDPTRTVPFLFETSVQNRADGSTACRCSIRELIADRPPLQLDNDSPGKLWDMVQLTYARTSAAVKAIIDTKTYLVLPKRDASSFTLAYRPRSPQEAGEDERIVRNGAVNDVALTVADYARFARTVPERFGLPPYRLFKQRGGLPDNQGECRHKICLCPAAHSSPKADASQSYQPTTSAHFAIARYCGPIHFVWQHELRPGMHACIDCQMCNYVNTYFTAARRYQAPERLVHNARTEAVEYAVTNSKSVTLPKSVYPVKWLHGQVFLELPTWDGQPFATPLSYYLTTHPHVVDTLSTLLSWQTFTHSLAQTLPSSTGDNNQGSKLISEYPSLQSAPVAVVSTAVKSSLVANFRSAEGRLAPAVLPLVLAGISGHDYQEKVRQLLESMWPTATTILKAASSESVSSMSLAKALPILFLEATRQLCDEAWVAAAKLTMQQVQGLLEGAAPGDETDIHKLEAALSAFAHMSHQERIDANLPFLAKLGEVRGFWTGGNPVVTIKDFEDAMQFAKSANIIGERFERNLIL
jgi:hypothetical protein